MDKSQGRVARDADAAAELPAVVTASGHRGLVMDEKLIFEQGVEGRCGVDLPEPPRVDSRLGGLERKGAITPDAADRKLEQQREKRQRLKDGLTVDGDER